MDSTFEALGRIGLIPMITIERVEHAVPLACALMDAGLGCVEITFRTGAAAEALSTIVREVRCGAFLCASVTVGAP